MELLVYWYMVRLVQVKFKALELMYELKLLQVCIVTSNKADGTIGSLVHGTLGSGEES